VAVEADDRLIAVFGNAVAVAAYIAADRQSALASAGLDGELRRWNAATREEIGRPLAGHTDAVLAMVHLV